MFLADTIANLNGRLDVIILGFFASAKVIGIYGIMVQLASVILVIRFAFDPIANPFFAEFHTRNEIPRLSEMYRLITRWIVMITIPFILVLALFGSEIATLIGRDYLVGYPWMLVLMFGATVAAFLGLSGYVLAMTGHPGSLLGINIIAFSISGFSMYFLVRLLGPLGAAIGTALSLVLTHAMGSWWVFRRLKIHPFTVALWKAPIAGILSGSMLGFLPPFAFRSPLWNIVANLPFLVVLYGALLVCLGLGEEERQFGTKFYHKIEGVFNRHPRAKQEL